MNQKFYKYINGRFILFYEEINGIISYENNCLGKFLWKFFHDKEKNKNKHFKDLQHFINN